LVISNCSGPARHPPIGNEMRRWQHSHAQRPECQLLWTRVPFVPFVLSGHKYTANIRARLSAAWEGEAGRPGPFSAGELVASWRLRRGKGMESDEKKKQATRGRLMTPCHSIAWRQGLPPVNVASEGPSDPTQTAGTRIGDVTRRVTRKRGRQEGSTLDVGSTSSNTPPRGSATVACDGDARLRRRKKRLTLCACYKASHARLKGLCWAIARTKSGRYLDRR
jgi:hypothetical protein